MNKVINKNHNAMIGVAVVMASVIFAYMPIAASADVSDYGCCDYGGGSYSPIDYGSGSYSPIDYGSGSYSSIDYGSGSYAATDYGSGSYSLTNYGSGSYSPTDYGSGSYSTTGYGSGSYSPSGTYTDFNGGTYSDFNGRTYQDAYVPGPSYTTVTDTTAVTPVYSYNPGTNYTSPVYNTGGGYSSGGYGGGGYSYGGGYSSPSYHPGTSYPYPIFNTVPIAHPVQIAQPVQIASNANTAPVVLNNTNTNTNVNTVPIQPVAQPQQIVQYVAPQPQPVYNYTPSYNYPYNYNNYNAPVSCYISSNVSNASYGQPVQLAWSSSGATSAYMSDGIGSVAANGTMAVNPSSTHTYTLTVYGQSGQSSSCNVTVSVNNYYVPPTAPVVQAPSAPYVSLNQIPYTGFDYGPLGNALYWLSFMAFAAAAGYLLVYYRGASVFAFAGRSAHKGAVAIAPRRSISEVETKREMVSNRIASVVANLPTREYRSTTTDTMSIARAANANEMPRIVISRA